MYIRQMKTMALSPIIALILLSSAASILASDMSIMDLINNNPSSPDRSDQEVMTIYNWWLAEHHKAKPSNGLIDETRFQIFKDNLRFVDEHNALNRSYKVGLNRFADLTNDEYRTLYLGTRPDPKCRAKNASNRYAVSSSDGLPDSIDWRLKGAVNPVKSQEGCGSCWAFSAIGAVEGINQIVTGELVSLSEQQLVDCDRAYNEGCNGGLMEKAFEYIISNGGIETESDYPYLGIDDQCHANRVANLRVVTIDGYEQVPTNNEKTLKKAVAHQPVSVGIDLGGKDMQHYVSGVFTGDCGLSRNHAVVVVGYGREKGIDYWIVRNSWGEKWGDGGYIKIERNVVDMPTGRCGIAIEPSYPVKNDNKMNIP